MDPGQLELIVGGMYSGKTEELIRRLTRAKIAQKTVQTFKPSVDDRYSHTELASHSRQRLKALVIQRAQQILFRLEPEVQVVGIDEAQFFDSSLVEIANRLADQGKRVIIAGLDTDWRGEPFPPLPALMATADLVTKLQAICHLCGAAASRTFRLHASQERVLVGSNASYQAHCRKCYYKNFEKAPQADRPRGTYERARQAPQVRV